MSFHLMICKAENLQSSINHQFDQNPWQLKNSPNTHYNTDTYYTNYRDNYNNNPKYDESLNEVVPDKIADKNFDAPDVATATTGGLPFISYALRGIAWLFVVGTLFLMFVGTVSAAFYR
jgi:hypothetical protein